MNNIKKVLLTGGGGMVGRNLMEHPTASRFEWFAPSHKELDLCVYSKVDNYIRTVKPDLVIHAAGRVGGIQANIKRPLDFYIQNLDMGRNVVIASKENGVTKLINLGSSCIYPRNANNPLIPSSLLSGVLEPTNEGYALAKLAIYKLCEYVSNASGTLRYKTIIPPNLFGRWDHFEPERSHLIAAIIHKLHQAKSKNQKQIEIWGTGSVRREFMFASDFADALFFSIERFDQLPLVLNAGIGIDHTVNEYYKECAEVMSYDGGFIHNTEMPEGMERKLLDSSELYSLGWQHKTKLKDAIKATYDFYVNEVLV